MTANQAATEQEIRPSIKLAGLENFISRLPEGFDSWVGEKGAKVSGGERRRIALARMYLKKLPHTDVG